MKQHKRVNPLLSQARAFWRVAGKKRREGDFRSGDWYELLAQQRYNQYLRSQGRKVPSFEELMKMDVGCNIS